MNLRVGIIAPSRVWDDLLRTEGVPFKFVDDMAALPGSSWSVLVVNRSLGPEERGSVEAYLNSGGAVLGSAKHMEGVAGTTSWDARLAYLCPDPRDRIEGAWLTDLSAGGMIPREANTMRTQTNAFALYAGPLKGGWAVILPFNVDEAMADTRSVNKNFRSVRDRLPSERVSVVAKGEVRHLVESSLRFLFRSRGIPYVHLWYFPRGVKNQFAFRVDTDASDRRDIDDLYGAAREFQLGLSWYLDVKSHEPWLDHFQYMTAQEIGLHCYHHLVYADDESNAKNLARARRAMEKAGLFPRGFAAPFGKWNLPLARVIDEFGFDYSSEFSFAYDTFPMRPITHEFEGLTIQVPIHPICIGSLRRIGYTEEQMSRYFLKVVDEKLARNEPLFFYHHPIHKSWAVVRTLFGAIRKRGIEPTTLGEFARWWGRRSLLDLSINDGDGMLNIERAGTPVNDDGEFRIRIVQPSGAEALTGIAERLRLDEVAWTSPAPLPAPADLSQTREFDPRRVVGDLYTSMTRRFR